MGKVNKKALGIAIAVTLLCGSTLSASAANELITNQSEADAKINTRFTSGEANYSTVGEIGSGSLHYGQIATTSATDSLNITGGSAGTDVLNISGTKNFGSGSVVDVAFSNAESRFAGKEVNFSDLGSLNLTIDGGTTDRRDERSGYGSNIFADNGGTVVVDSTVKNFHALNHARTVMNARQNLLARANGTIKILSPDVELNEDKTDRDPFGQTINVSAQGDNASIQLGDADHVLHTVSIQYKDLNTNPGDTWHLHGLHGIEAIADDGNTDPASTRVSIFSQKVTISPMEHDIYSEGSTNYTDKDVLVEIGDRNHMSDEISVEGITTGAWALNNGKIHLYGKKISVNTNNTGLNVTRGGKITVGAGSGDQEGLVLQGPSSDIRQSTGIQTGGGSGSEADVESGNILIQDFDYGVRTGDTAPYGGTVNLGTASSPANDIVFHNIRTDALRANGGGSIRVNARSLTGVDSSAGSMYADTGSINVHTSDIALLKGNIGNRSGYININTNPGDGATDFTGIIGTVRGYSRTHVVFHSNRSHFYGNVFDGNSVRNDGQTTIDVSDGADWVVNPSESEYYSMGVPEGKYHSYLDTLNLGEGGTVDLGGRGNETGPDTAHTYMRVRRLAGGGGTLVFRTNLQESADTRTVIGHSDQLTIPGDIPGPSPESGESSGTHTIMIRDASRTLGRAAENGYVLLVNDQSPSHGAVFRGDANLQNGGLFARRAEITNEAPDASLGYTDVPATGNNWYLRLVGDRIYPTPTINAENNKTFSRSRYGALWIEQETLRERLGELRDHKQDDGIWARITRGEYTMNGVSGNADYTMYHIGYDKRIGNQSGHKQYIGMAYHHTDTDLNYRHFTDDSDMDADIGTIYYTNLGDKGHYLDIVGKFGRMKGKMKTFGEFPESAKWDSPFYSLSAEYGRKINYDNGWYWEPQAQLTYSHLGSDNYLTSQGTHAHLDNINSLIFRTGFTVGKKNGRNEYYGKVFWQHEFEGAEDAYFHDKNDDRLRDSYDFGSSWVTVGLGGQVGLSKDAYLYGDVEKSFGGDVKKKWAWNIGVRIGF